MTSYTFFFNADTFEYLRMLARDGMSAPIDYVAAANKRPMNDFAAGDELFIVGLSGCGGLI